MSAGQLFPGTASVRVSIARFAERLRRGGSLLASTCVLDREQGGDAMQTTTQPTATKEQRKYVDCREQPQSSCTLRISGTEKEVLEAARLHAVSAHGHEDSPALVEMLRSGLGDDR
jgi:hypothetical protein